MGRCRTDLKKSYQAIHRLSNCIVSVHVAQVCMFHCLEKYRTTLESCRARSTLSNKTCRRIISGSQCYLLPTIITAFIGGRAAALDTSPLEYNTNYPLTAVFVGDTIGINRTMVDSLSRFTRGRISLLQDGTVLLQRRSLRSYESQRRYLVLNRESSTNLSNTI